MRCPKCGYISFDYNQVCPKCNKNIADEQAKLNIPAFRPNPPSLLGILTGEGDESNIGLESNLSKSMGDSHEMDVGLDDSVVGLDTSEIGFDKGHDLDDIGLKQEDSGELELSGEEETLAVDSEEISVEDNDTLVMPSDEGEGEEISLDLEDVSLEEGGEEEISFSEDISEEKGGEEISLDEISLGDSDVTGDIANEETVLAPDSIDLDIDLEKEAGGEEKSEIELNLTDLKINETGELEIGKDLEPAKEAEEDSLDLGDLSIDDAGPSDEEETLELGDMPSEEPDADDTTKAFNKTISTDESGLEAMLDESPLEDISLDISEDQGPADTAESEMSLDLENLDLDLDLDGPEDKS
jgi:hypothetical protein